MTFEPLAASVQAVLRQYGKQIGAARSVNGARVDWPTDVAFGSCVTSIADPNGMHSYTRDEGGPFGFGNQVLISSHRKLLSSKATVVNVAETSVPAGMVERGERKQPAEEVSK